MEELTNANDKIQGHIYERSNNSFSYLWKTIIKRFTFERIHNNSDKEVCDIRSRLNVNLYQYRDLDKYLIYADENADTQIYIKGPKDVLHLFHSIYAVKDATNVNRYLVTFTFDGYLTDNNISGIIIYFDKQQCIRQNNINANLCDFDTRNGPINEKKTIFYKNNIIFYQIHRDTHCPVLFINVLSRDDTILHYISKHIDGLKYVIPYLIDIDSRFIKFKNNDTKQITLLDLDDITIEEKKEQKLGQWVTHKLLLISKYTILEEEYDCFIERMGLY